MAELDTSSGGGHKGTGVKKAKKLSTRVDLTPMVDLGFLLITFFIFTTTLSQPSTMKLNMPKDDVDTKDLMPIKESGALTILMGKNNQIYYYLGIDPNKLQSTTYTKIRDVVLNKKRSTPSDDFFVTIKPDDDATYENTVNVLDEMTIDDVKKYAIDKPSDVEVKNIHLTEEANGIK
ncbi:MAG: biopolymer transporter ExbD [Ferruginibacter sp.]